MYSVYRLEGSNGEGPYGGYTPTSRTILDVHVSETHPGPCDDFNRKPYRDEYFGCETITQLMEWFDGYFEDLLDEGYQVIRYEVPDYLVMIGISGKQIMFQREGCFCETVEI